MSTSTGAVETAGADTDTDDHPVGPAAGWSSDRLVIATELERSRARTLALLDELGEDDQRAQHAPIMSPMVWDLAHIGNYEEQWLLRALDGREPIDAALDDVYDAFAHPRRERPSLPILGPAEARAYVARVRGDVLDLLQRVDLTGDQDELLRDAFVYGMVLQHEHQHDETILATRQLMGERATAPPGARPVPPGTIDVDALPEMVLVDGGPFVLGTAGHPWAYDNEREAHTVELAPYRIDTTPVTNRGFRAFIADGGYDTDELWSPAGLAWLMASDDGHGDDPGGAPIEHPLFWRREGQGAWSVLRFGARLDLDTILDEPVQHVSFHEAEAFARWTGKRLPTEAEWEKAATWHPAEGARRYPWGDSAPTAAQANLGQRHAGPAPVGAHPDGVSPWGCLAMVGDVWEWTASDFLPYPGFVAFPYRAYSEVFWGDAYKVLKGGSWAADPIAVRGSFRNWDHPVRRQIFSGFRCAVDA